MHENLTCFFHDVFEIYYITLGTQVMLKYYLNDTVHFICTKFLSSVKQTKRMLMFTVKVEQTQQQRPHFLPLTAQNIYISWQKNVELVKRTKFELFNENISCC